MFGGRGEAEGAGLRVRGVWQRAGRGLSEGTVRDHYLNGERSEEEAVEYWSLTPEVVLTSTKKLRALFFS